jgi:hypothetical protein
MQEGVVTGAFTTKGTKEHEGGSQAFPCGLLWWSPAIYRLGGIAWAASSGGITYAVVFTAGITRVLCGEEDHPPLLVQNKDWDILDDEDG